MSALDDIDTSNLKDNDYAKCEVFSGLKYYIQERKGCNITEWCGFSRVSFADGEKSNGIIIKSKKFTIDDGFIDELPVEILFNQKRRKEPYSADQARSMLFLEIIYGDNNSMKCYPSPVGYFDGYKDNPNICMLQLFAHDPSCILYIVNQGIHPSVFYSIAFLEYIASFFIYKPRYAQNQKHWPLWAHANNKEIRISEKEWEIVYKSFGTDRENENTIVRFDHKGIEYIDINEKPEHYKQEDDQNNSFKHNFLKYRVIDENDNSIHTAYVYICHLHDETSEYEKPTGFMMAFMRTKIKLTHVISTKYQQIMIKNTQPSQLQEQRTIEDEEFFDPTDDQADDEIIDSGHHLMTNEEIFTDEYMLDFAEKMDAKIAKEKLIQNIISVSVVLGCLLFISLIVYINFRNI